jgi:hypothetical protein
MSVGATCAAMTNGRSCSTISSSGSAGWITTGPGRKQSAYRRTISRRASWRTNVVRFSRSSTRV